MSGRVSFDSNILVYSLSRSDMRKRQLAYELLRNAAVHGDGVISYQIVQEVFHVALKGLEPLMTLQEVELYFAALRSELTIVGWSETLVEEAFALKRRYRFQWFDCLMLAASLKAECDVVYTEDLQHGQVIEGLRVVNPFL